MNTTHIGITYTQRNGLRRYRKNQRKADRIAKVKHNRRHDDVSLRKVICGAVFLGFLFAAGIFWDTHAVQSVVQALRMQP